MIEYLETLDRQLLLFFNGLNNPVVDSIMWFLSDKYVWIPLYVFIIIFSIRIAGWRGVFWILTMILTFGLTDLISVHAFKEVFERYRPTHNLEIQHLIHTVNDYRGGMYGFVSSHAANTFGLATISSLLIKKRWYVIAIFIWAAMVSYSRIYLGVHYPSDIIGGALLGVLCGYIAWQLYRLLPSAWKHACQG